MSPRTAKQFHAMREESRANILQHALDLFARFGYEQTSVRMIAEAAGISQGLMYRYFASKEDLLQAIFVQSMEDVHGVFAAADEAADPYARLERLIRQSFVMLQHPQAQRFWKLSYSVRMQPAVMASLGEQMQLWPQAIRQTLEAHFRAIDSDDPAAQAAILFALIDGIAQHYTLDPETYPLDAVVERVVAQYCRP